MNPPQDSALRFSNHSDTEKLAGYSRAARHENVIAVSGTTADLADGRALLGDTYEQSIVALKRALSAVAELGGAHDSVVRTRMLLAPGADWKAASMAHRELLGDVAPANSMYYVHSLIGDGYLVEVEIDAVVINEPLAQDQPR